MKNKTQNSAENTADTPRIAVTPVRAPKMAELVAGQIRKSVIDGKLKTGDRLPPEIDMIAQFGVSRGVIREALRLLESEHVVQVKRGAKGGAIITSPQTHAVGKATLVSLQMQRTTISDFYACTTLIEPPAARYAAEHRAAAAAAALQQFLEYMEQCRERGDEVEIANAVNDFHFTLLENCGNKTLQIMSTSVRKVLEVQIAQLHWAFKPRLKPGIYDEFINTAYRASHHVTELIGKGNGGAAERYWRKHMENAGEVFFSVVSRDLLVG